MTLQELRVHRGLTQTDLASRLAMQQAGASKLEARADMYVSMLRSFIEALGGKLEITAVCSSERIPVSGFDKGGVVEDLQRLRNRPCRLHPMPADRANDSFRVESVTENGNVILYKTSNHQSVEVPVRRVVE